MNKITKNKDRKVSSAWTFDLDKFWPTTTKGLAIILTFAIWLIVIYLLVDLHSIKILLGG